MFTIRESRPSDAEDLAALNRAFNGVGRDAAGIRELLAAPSTSETVLVAEAEGGLVGFLCLQTLHSICYDHPWVEVTELYVLPDHRGQGVGRALIDGAETRAASSGASELVLRTNSENARARSLCRRVGFDAADHVVYRRRYSGAV